MANGGRQTLTAEQSTAMLRRVRSGERWASVCAAYGLSERSLRALAREAGVPSRFMRPAARQDVLARWAAGEATASIAGRHNVTPRRVQQLAREAGLSSRRGSQYGEDPAGKPERS